MRAMRSIGSALLAARLFGCAQPQYGVERQLTLSNGTHPVWAVAPAINLSGESQVDPILQADLVFQQLQSVNNLTVIPVNRVVQVYAALRIDKVESEQQAALVCDQLGCDGLVIPTITIYDPYNPPKLGVALQLLTKPGAVRGDNVDARELARRATPGPEQALAPRPGFIQVVGMYDARNGSVRAGLADYARGRSDPDESAGANLYLLSMDRYCGFVYHVLIAQLVDRVVGRPGASTQPSPPPGQRPPLTAQPE